MLEVIDAPWTARASYWRDTVPSRKQIVSAER